jgi:hypothetical protein
MANKRPRFKTAMLVGSTNPLKSIMARRLEVAIRYIEGVPNKVIKQEVIGVRTVSF